MAKVDENYIERLCNAVAKAVMEAFENLTIEDVDMYKIGYNNAIEEFAEQLISKVESFTAEVNGFRADLMTLDYFTEFVDEIAESMKGEKE